MKEKRVNVRLNGAIKIGRREAVGLLALLLLCVLPLESGADSLTMTTWYPAPYGVYTNLRSTQDAYFAYKSGKVGIGLPNGSYTTTVPPQLSSYPIGPSTLDVNGIIRVAGSSANSAIIELNALNTGSRVTSEAGIAFSRSGKIIWGMGMDLNNTFTLVDYNDNGSSLGGFNIPHNGGPASFTVPVSIQGINLSNVGVSGYTTLYTDQSYYAAYYVAANNGFYSPNGFVWIGGSINAGGNISGSGVYAGYIQSSGNVQANNAFTGNSVYVNYVQSNGDIRANNNLSAGGYIIASGFQLPGSCGGSCWSDRRLKKDILPVTGAAETVARLNPVSWTWTDEAKSEAGVSAASGRQWGLVAQEVEGVLPELVSEGKDGYKRVNYGGELQMLALTAIKELKAKVDRQDAEIAALKGRLDAAQKGAARENGK